MGVKLLVVNLGFVEVEVKGRPELRAWMNSRPTLGSLPLGTLAFHPDTQRVTMTDCRKTERYDPAACLHIQFLVRDTVAASLCILSQGLPSQTATERTGAIVPKLL